MMTSSAHREKEDTRTEVEQRRTDLVELERRLETDDELGAQLETIMSGVEERSPKSELEDLSADERDIDDAYAEAMLERSAIDGDPVQPLSFSPVAVHHRSLSAEVVVRPTLRTRCIQLQSHRPASSQPPAWPLPPRHPRPPSSSSAQTLAHPPSYRHVLQRPPHRPRNDVRSSMRNSSLTFWRLVSVLPRAMS